MSSWITLRYTTGLAIPQFTVDSPLGKIPLIRCKLVEPADKHVVLPNHEGYYDYSLPGEIRTHPSGNPVGKKP
ncbi:MAG: hypothetical protein GX986_09375 [Firmicutes bacterium]|nr:hypothetical protein [Bacillota bacterium]